MASLKEFLSKTSEFSAKAMSWLDAHGLAAHDVQFLGLVLGFIAVLFAFVAFKKAKNISSGISHQRLAEKVDRASIQTSDLKGATEKEFQRLSAETATLRDRLARLERAVTGESGALTPEDKKKLEQQADAVASDILRAPEAFPTHVSASLESESAGDLKKSSIFSGLKKTRDAFFGRLTGILSRKEPISEATLSELEELLISSDLGVRTSQKLLQGLRSKIQSGAATDAETCREVLREDILNILRADLPSEISPEQQNGQPKIILVVGVNGVGKTTTIGKLATRFSRQGAKVLLGAADTFRAAAVEQIEIWAERAEVELLRGTENAKPATVAFDAVHRGQDGKFDVVMIDTAGRLHTRVNLMNELGSVISIIEREQAGAPHETLLVVDATTGQNALEQAREFHMRAKLSGIVVTKLDGTPKGGIVVAIRDELGIPIRYVGVGESASDLKAFSAEEFVDALFSDGDSSSSFTAATPKAEVRAVRRRRTDGELMM